MQWTCRKSEVNAQTSHSSEGREASGKPVALFSPRRDEERERETKCGVLRSVGFYAQAIKITLLNQARSDLARKEIHMESLNKCVDLQKRTEVQERALQEVQNEFVESRREQARLLEKFLRKENALRHTRF